MPFTSTIVWNNPEPGDTALIKGFKWTVTHPVVNVKITQFQVRCKPIGGTPHTPRNILIALTKTGDKTAATVYRSIALVADGADYDLATLDFSAEISLTTAEAASGNVGVIIDWSQAFVNCEVDLGNVQMQVCQSASSGSITGNGLIYGEYSNCDEYVAVVNGGSYSENGQYVDSASANHWSANLMGATILGALYWNGCQFGSEEFMTEPSTGVFRRQICGLDAGGNPTPWVPLYQDYIHPGSDGDGLAQIISPPYTPHAFSHTNDTLGVQANTTSPAMAVTLTFDATTNLPTMQVTGGGWAGTGYYEFELDLGTAVDFYTGQNLMTYLMLHFGTSKTLNGDGQFTDGDNSNLGFQSTLTNYQINMADSTGFVAGHQTGYRTATKLGTIANSSQRDCYVFFDLNTNVSTFPAIMSAVKKIRIRFGPRGVGRPDYYYLKEFIPLGQYYHYNFPGKQLTVAVDPSNDGDLIYAFNYTEAAQTGLSTENARKITVTATQDLGDKLEVNVPYGGSFVTLTVPTAPAPFTNAALINIYRQEGAVWQRVSQSADNTAPLVFTDTLTDGTITGDTTTYPITTLVFDPLTAADSGQATNMINCCSAFGSLIFFGSDGLAYGSATNSPQIFFWPNINPDLTGIAANEVPRTLAIANNRGLPVLVGIYQQALYMFTRKEGYVMRSLSTFAVADFPSKLSGCRGVCGTRAACAFDGGALFGSDDGLWYVAVNPYQPTVGGEEKPPALTEVTSTNRGLWSKLIGSATDRVGLVVQTTGQDIWCFCQSRYIHIDMRRGRVLTYGEWANGKSVNAAYGDPKRGMVILFSDGTLGVCGNYMTDGGLDASGLTGTVPSWSWKGKRFTSPMSLLAVRAVWENQLPSTQTPTGQVTAFSIRGSASGDSIDFTDTGGVGQTPFDTSIVQSNKKPGGDWSEIQLSGSAWDKVTHLELHAAPDQPKRIPR